MVKIWLEGGSFIRPMFIDFRSDNLKDQLYNMDDQFMLGSNFMVSPVIYPGDRKKKTYFPDELFYNFYNGKVMNPNGEGFIQIDAPLDSLPIFLRAGFITPVQDSLGITMINQLRKRPFEVIVALDSNFRAAGRIFFDDGYSDKTIVSKEYYRMDITANLAVNSTKTLELTFKYFDYNFEKSI